MIKKLLCIGMILFLSNVYCMEKEALFNSITIGKNITIKEMQLCKVKLFGVEKTNTYLILLSTDGRLFVYSDSKKNIQEADISISLTSLRFASIFKKPIWKHIAAPIKYNSQDYLPIATDSDVFLAKISSILSYKNDKLINPINFDITEKIISHNTKIHTVQSFNENCVISSSTYPTTKFWYADNKTKKDDLAGHLFLGGGTSELYFIKDKYNAIKWDRWQDRNNPAREGTLCIKDYGILTDKKEIPAPSLNILEPDIVFATMNKTAIVKANSQYYRQDNATKLTKFEMPEEFTPKLTLLNQLYLTTLEKQTSYLNETESIPYVIGITSKKIFLWQLDLQENEQSRFSIPKTHLYSIKLRKINIQKAAFNRQDNILYIVYKKGDDCKIGKYSIPKNYSDMKVSSILTKSANIQNKPSEKSSKEEEVYGPVGAKSDYSNISSSLSHQVTTAKTSQAITNITINTIQNKQKEIIKVPLLRSDNMADFTNDPSEFKKGLDKQAFTFEKIVDSQSKFKQKIYFKSNDNEIIVIHYFGLHNSYNYAEHFKDQSKETSVVCTSLTFLKKKLPKTNEFFISTQTSYTKGTEERVIEAPINTSNGDPHDIDILMKDLENRQFNFSEIITKKDSILKNFNYIDYIVTLFIFTDKQGDQIHIEFDDYKPSKAFHFTKEHLDKKNPLKK
jgi:hypothetical protein